MNKQEARFALTGLHDCISDFKASIKSTKIEILRLQSIIDAPPVPKAGRVMSVDDLFDGQTVYRFIMGFGAQAVAFSADNVDFNHAIRYGRLFHDADTCNKFGEYLELEQELRRAQIADDGEGEFKGNTFVLNKHGELKSLPSDYLEKVAFSTKAGLSAFIASHTDEKLKLLIRGV